MSLMGIIHISLFHFVIYVKILLWYIGCHSFATPCEFTTMSTYKTIHSPNEYLRRYYIQCALKTIEIKNVIDL